MPEPPAFSDTVDIASWGRQYHQDVGTYINAIDPAALAEAVNIPWAEHVSGRFGQPPSPATLAETMVQVTTHSTHHRGQVNARLRQLGGEPPLTDFIVWVWLGKPVPKWPMLHAQADPTGV